MKELGNTILHLLGGAALVAAVLWSEWMLIPTTFVWAWLREQAQHRDDGWFGWQTPHRIWEVAQWTLGSAVMVLLWKWIKASIAALA